MYLVTFFRWAQVAHVCLQTAVVRVNWTHQFVNDQVKICENRCNNT